MESLPDETEFNLKDIPATWQYYIKSIIAFTYTNIEVDDGKVLKTYGAKEAHELNVAKINNGISLEYIFEKLQITIKIEFKLVNNCLIVEIPHSGIKEEGRYGLIKIELLPFSVLQIKVWKDIFLYPMAVVH